jgi:HEAT repeat protein
LILALNDESGITRHRAAEALARIGSSAGSALDSLAARLEDPEPPVRKAAAEALGRIGAGPAAGPLQARLRDQVSDVRQAAAESLGRLGRAAVPAVPLLLELQADAAENVRRAATDALMKIVLS